MAASLSQPGPAALFAAVARSRAQGWEDVVEGVRPFLTQVTQRLAAQVDAFEPEIAEYARYALSNQGKQLRPALVGLAARTVGEWNEDLVTVAVIIEMVHLATLVHDDIMDGAALRRMRPTLAAKWGADVAVLVGDCLFAHALNLAAAFPTTEVSRAIARSTHVVCSGEILQTLRRRRWAMNRAEYFKMLEMKTAELFALACDLGVMLGGGTDTQRAALRGFGLSLGTAYQVYDDCLDLFGSEDDAGKSLGTDLARGKVTLPLLAFLERAQPAERAQMIGWLERWDPSYFVGVRSLVEQHHGLEVSRAEIDTLLSGGRRLLEALPAGRPREALGAIAEILSEQTAALGV
ncbi:MAG: polyprenyl synthetase family protein [Verrucomicrobiota bacterium]